MSVPPDDDEPVPRIPRGRGIRLDGAMVARIGLTLALLIMIVVTAGPCATATSKFVTGFSEEGSGNTQMPKPGNVDVLPEDKGSAADYERMGGTMTEAEQRAAFERAKAKAAARAAEREGSAAASGSAAGTGGPMGSATGSAAAPSTPTKP